MAFVRHLVEILHGDGPVVLFTSFLFFSFVQELGKNFWHLKNLVEREVDIFPQRKFQILVPEEEEMSSWHSVTAFVHFGTDSPLLSVGTYLCSCYVKSFRMETLTLRFVVPWCSWAPDCNIFCERSIISFQDKPVQFIHDHGMPCDQPRFSFCTEKMVLRFS